MGKGEKPIKVVFMVDYCCGLKNPEQQVSGLSNGRAGRLGHLSVNSVFH